ncbi:MAG: hypothetical protein KGY76_05640 [Candidatus Thermoplasmatota archaeon]|nr:hypothetical protein [Candidatus Thermoplasmatota archaeon]
MEIVILLYALFLSIFHLLCDKLPRCIHGSHGILLSYGGGSLLALIFLVFLPEAFHLTSTLTVYPLMLLGFVLFFLAEKYLYQHVKDPAVLDEELYHLHLIGFFIDHFIKGFILVTIILLEPVLGFLAAIPFFIHTLSSSIALEQLHEYSGRKIDKVLLSSSTVLGTTFGILFKMNTYMERHVLAFISGMMLFMVSRDILPKEKEGRPLFFILGVITIFFIWLGLEFSI